MPTTRTPLKVAIVGPGGVGSTLGKQLLAHGHRVKWVLRVRTLLRATLCRITTLGSLQSVCVSSVGVKEESRKIESLEALIKAATHGAGRGRDPGRSRSLQSTRLFPSPPSPMPRHQPCPAPIPSLRYGSRTPGADKVREVLVRQPTASATTVDDACRWADAIILATPGRQVTCPSQHPLASAHPLAQSC